MSKRLHDYVYRLCDISIFNKSTSSINFFYVLGTPTTTTLVYNETTRSLTCTSTGGPATTVTWRKSGAVISLNATYQQTQVVTDPVTGTYQTVLAIDHSVTDIFGTYSCTVGNTRGTSAAIETTRKDLFTISAAIVIVIPLTHLVL